MIIRHRITAREQARIVELLKTLPLPEVREKTNRSYRTLIRIAEAVL